MLVSVIKLANFFTLFLWLLMKPYTTAFLCERQLFRLGSLVPPATRTAILSLIDDSMPIWSGKNGLILEDAVKDFRSGFVAIVGRSNAGKSTLLNQLIGKKVSIVSHKPQTTRHRIMGVMSKKDFQCVFYDTPGLLEAKYSLHTKMMESVGTALKSADMVLVVVDITQESNSEELDQVLSYLSKVGGNVVLVLNKIDIFAPDVKQKLAKELEINKVVHTWSVAHPKANILPLSAITGVGVDELVEKLRSLMPLGPPLYHASTSTDKSPEFIASEIIREKLFSLYGREIPFSCEVQVNSFEMIKGSGVASGGGGGSIVMSAVIYVERKSQVGIIVGKSGAAVKRLIEQSQPELKKQFNKRVVLNLGVKCMEKWRTCNKQLKSFGYGE